MNTNPTVLSQHAGEASFLWMLRNSAVGAPHYDLADLAKLDDRVEAHLEGLRIGGAGGWMACEEQLAANESGEVFAAASLSLEPLDQDRLSKVLSVVGKVPETIGGFASAVGWLPLEQALPHIRKFLEGERPSFQGIGISAAAIHRWHPGAALARLMASDDADVRARALKSAGEFGDKDVRQDLLVSLRDPDENCVFSAAWSGTLLGLPICATVLLSIAESQSSHAPSAADLALRGMDTAAALSWHSRVVAAPARIRLAIRTAGTIGDPSVIPWLISLMEQPPLARLAGECFTMITGVDLAFRDLERDPPEGHEAGPTEDPADHNVEMDPDENLPWPEPALVQQWWDANRGRFQHGTRYLLGNPLTDDWLRIVLRDGRQRQRAAAALELALRNPGQPLFNVKAPGFRQQQLLGKGEVIR